MKEVFIMKKNINVIAEYIAIPLTVILSIILRNVKLDDEYANYIALNYRDADDTMLCIEFKENRLEFMQQVFLPAPANHLAAHYNRVITKIHKYADIKDLKAFCREIALYLLKNDIDIVVRITLNSIPYNVKSLVKDYPPSIFEPLNIF